MPLIEHSHGAPQVQFIDEASKSNMSYPCVLPDSSHRGATEQQLGRSLEPLFALGGELLIGAAHDTLIRAFSAAPRELFSSPVLRMSWAHIPDATGLRRGNWRNPRA